jgi:hypothetical protein
VSTVRPGGPIVIDTDVFSAELVPGSRLAERYAPLITGRLAFISFQTAAELRYGAIRRGWGQPRMLRMEATIVRLDGSSVGLCEVMTSPVISPHNLVYATGHRPDREPIHAERRLPSA